MLNERRSGINVDQERREIRQALHSPLPPLPLPDISG
jgi:hypothetical protein